MPLVQLSHLELFTSYLPAAHAKHKTDPVAAEIFPGGQLGPDAYSVENQSMEGIAETYRMLKLETVEMFQLDSSDRVQCHWYLNTFQRYKPDTLSCLTS